MFRRFITSEFFIIEYNCLDNIKEYRSGFHFDV